ncbi:ABC transporter substrate-binding protein [Minwuia sp.]|uniref:ABC transporter substrate-binding protein n=1 Tax=Minwuia sp. TaxID=2493630 RepID=UPI003A8D0BCA
MIDIRGILKAVAIALTACMIALSPAKAAGERAVVENLNAVLLETMQEGRERGFAWRYEKLSQSLPGIFDFPLMAQIGLQRHWSGIAEVDRRRIIDAFTRMSVSTFASRFDDFKGERFEVEGEKPGPRDLVLVSSVIHRTTKEPVTLTYVVRPDDDTPKVIDVLAQGRFSELARQRAEMSSVYGASGVDGLVKALNDKAAQLAAE